MLENQYQYNHKYFVVYIVQQLMNNNYLIDLDQQLIEEILNPKMKIEIQHEVDHRNK
jgi:hypothetical protein